VFLKKSGKNSGLKTSLPGDFGDTSLDPVDYRRSIDPLFDFFMEYSDNGILNPGSAHIGEDFSGSFSCQYGKKGYPVILVVFRINFV